MALKKISATKDGDFFTSKNSGGLFLGIRTLINSYFSFDIMD